MSERGEQVARARNRLIGGLWRPQDRGDLAPLVQVSGRLLSF